MSIAACRAVMVETFADGEPADTRDHKTERCPKNLHAAAAILVSALRDRVS